ncbi:four helix bundle protein [Fulvivirga sp. RKSG066]|uniref:four helix bundle protein n=1 Tax=Fulvivirga aurantia TaxID=2529383 RepID=UPI0012BD2E7D|nr:four helix bundle protein [Fulvivirga aurantia]MTI20681.1 four helix bundle protein [Fulvivirga aurantia]
MHQFKKLSVWQKAMSLTTSVYELTENFPAKEQFGLTTQIRRSSVSVASNIAEGAGRNSKGEFKQFLGIATGSLYELETQLLISSQVGYTDEQRVNGLISSIEEIHKMLIGLKASLN